MGTTYTVTFVYKGERHTTSITLPCAANTANFATVKGLLEDAISMQLGSRNFSELSFNFHED